MNYQPRSSTGRDRAAIQDLAVETLGETIIREINEILKIYSGTCTTKEIIKAISYLGIAKYDLFKSVNYSELKPLGFMLPYVISNHNV